MTPLDAPGDTWGISGPTFLAGYLLVAALVVLASIVQRAWIFDGRRSPGFDQLGPEQVAYLNGGSRLALYSAIGVLRGVGALGVDDNRLLRATGPLPVGATPLDQAIHLAASRGMRTRDLSQDPGVAGALRQLRQDLEHRGLALSPAQRFAARLGPMVLALLLVVGALRLTAGTANDQPVGFLVAAIVMIAAVMLVQLLRMPHRTRAGRTALRNVRGRYRHLTPSSSPAYATYGANGAAMGVALFGVTALWALDPDFADAAEIEQQANASGSTGGGCGGGSGGSDSGGGDGGGSGCSSCSGCGGCGG